MQRCKAKSKRSQQQCKNYAIKGTTVCRMHGARGGPKTDQGRYNCKKGPTKHGMCCRKRLDELKFLRAILKNKHQCAIE